MGGGWASALSGPHSGKESSRPGDGDSGTVSAGRKVFWLPFIESPGPVDLARTLERGSDLTFFVGPLQPSHRPFPDSCIPPTTSPDRCVGG